MRDIRTRRRFSGHPPPGSFRPSTSVIYVSLLSCCSDCDLGELVVELPASDSVQDSIQSGRASQSGCSVRKSSRQCVIPLSRAKGGPVAVPARPRATLDAARANDVTERRRRCVHPAPNLQYPRGLPCGLGRPCVVEAVQVALTPRIRPRGVQRSGGYHGPGGDLCRLRVGQVSRSREVDGC